MKTIDLFCASPASTAICSSLENRATVRHATRPVDNRRVGDRRIIKAPIPCSSQLPFDPKPYYQNSRKHNSTKHSEVRRKSSPDINDLTTPTGSSRYLLSDKPYMDFLSDSDHHNHPDHHHRHHHHRHVSALVTSQPARPRVTSLNGSSSTLPLPLARPRDQVVELRVSIHCKGCEGKVRKHISRMEGVTSFSIDLATKKVTVIGDVTPLGVLTSVSRVKNAQFWPSPTSSSSSSSSPLVGFS